KSQAFHDAKLKKESFLGSSRLTIESLLGKLSELLIGVIFLLECLMQQSRRVVQPELFRPSNQGSIAGDLVMLDRLRIGDHAGIEHIWSVGAFYVPPAFLEVPL